jgi:peptidoglycan-associated lipoprotein
MLKKLIYQCCFFVLLMFLSSCGAKSRLTTADKKFEAGEFAPALSIYRKVYDKIPYKETQTKARVAFRMGECYSKLNQSQAESMYQRAIRSKYQDSTVYVRYARALHRNGKYSEAGKYYKLVIDKDSIGILAKNGLEAIDNVPRWKAEPTRHVVKRDPLFYTRNAYVFSPAFQGYDSETLYFSSTKSLAKKDPDVNYVSNQPNAQLFFIKKDLTGKWSKPEPVFSQEMVKGSDIGASAFTPDGRKMFITKASQKAESDASVEIYTSSRAGGEWSEPRKITFFKDTSISVAHPAIGMDGETIYFVSDAPGGFGGKDIWKGKISGNECKFVENMGPQINTPGDEMFPYVRMNGELYFSSDGLPGLGGLDLFKAEVLPENQWKVTNMGIPMNSNYDDFGICFDAKKESGYFSSNRGQTKGFDAIWSFVLPEMEVLVEGKIMDDKNNPIPDATIRLVSNTGLNTRVTSRKDGTYKIKIEKDMDCVMLGVARGFLNKSASVSSAGVKGSKTFNIDFVLPAVFRPVQMKNIFYEFAKWDLTSESEAGLQELLKILVDNPAIVMELSAHTDFIGNNEANKILSQKRAQSVVDYLINAGISADRLISKGYGEENPVVADENLNALYAYIPAGQVLNETFILTLTPEQQVAVNQINRRTEFKVVKMNYK